MSHSPPIPRNPIFRVTGAWSLSSLITSYKTISLFRNNLISIIFYSLLFTFLQSVCFVCPLNCLCQPWAIFPASHTFRMIKSDGIPMFKINHLFKHFESCAYDNMTTKAKIKVNVFQKNQMKNNLYQSLLF